MKLTFSKRHRSVKALDEIEVPSFAILVGLNGSGKSHLLDAIANGSVKVRIGDDEVPATDVRMIGFRDVTLQNIRGHDVDAPALIRKKLVQQRATVRTAAVTRIAEIYKSYGLVVDLSESSPLSVVPESTGSSLPAEKLADLREELYQYCINQVNSFQSAFVSPHSRGMGTHDEDAARRLQERIGRPLVDLTEAELRWNNGLLDSDVPLLANSFSELFGNYRKLEETHRLLTCENQVFKTNHSVLSEEEFKNQIGPPPWNIANRLLESADIPIKFEEPPEQIDGNYLARAIHVHTGDSIPLTDLSSGEQVLMALTMAIWGRSDSRHTTKLPRVLLLDEVDAPLHASMIRSFISMIREILVGELGLEVILATHSASTVALCEEQRIYKRCAGDPKLHIIANDEAIRTLTAGIPTLSIRVESRRPVFVESDNDVRFYELIAEAFSSYLTNLAFTFNFMSTASKKNKGDLTGSDRVGSIVSKLNDAGVDQVRGLVDRDSGQTRPLGIEVLGGDERYTIENFILDPLMVGLFLVKMRFFSKLSLNEIGLSNERDAWGGADVEDEKCLQGIIDGILKSTGLNDGPQVHCKLVGGLSVNVTKKFCDYEGHLWEDLLKETYPELKRHNQQPVHLKSAVLEHVWMTYPSLAPASVLATLRTLSS